MKTSAATRTEMTGPRLREATVKNCRHERLRVRDGGQVKLLVAYPADDGGHLEGYYTGTVTRLARGTEHGMHGSDTLIVELAMDARCPIRTIITAARRLAEVVS